MKWTLPQKLKAPKFNLNLNLNFLPTGGNYLGVDAGSERIKFIHVKGTKPPFDIVRAWTENRQSENFVNRVRDQIKGFRYTNHRSAYSIADEKAEFYEFHLPKLEGSELETAIQWEMKKAIATTEFVYHDVDVQPQGAGLEIKCTVATKEIVDQQFDQGTRFGLRPFSLEPESSALMACAEAVFGKEKCERLAVIDLGYTTFRFIFIHSGRVVFTRALYTGLGNIFQIAAKNLGLSVQECADVFLKICSQEEIVDEHYRVLEKIYQEHLFNVCEEFRRLEMFVREQKGLEDLHELKLCGGGGCFPNISELLSRQLPDKKIGTLNPFLGARKKPTDLILNAGPLWACAFGLSLRRN